MSMTTVSMNASDGLQNSQKTAQPAPGSGVQRALSATRAASVPDDISKTPAAKVAAGAKDGEVKLSAGQVQQSVEELNKVMADLSISVQFKIDPDYKELIVRVVDQDTGKLIRQIPTAEVVKMSKAMDNLKGQLFSQSV